MQPRTKAELGTGQGLWYNTCIQGKTVERYFFLRLLFVTLIFTFFIFQPFWVVLILGLCFAIVLNPIHKWMTDRRVPNWLSAFLTVVIFTLIVCGPLLGIGTLVFNQSEDVYHKVVSNGNAGTFLNDIGNSINAFLPQDINIDFTERAKDFVSYLSNNIAIIFTTTLSAFFSFILMLLIIFYFLKDGAEWKRSLIALSPLEDTYDQKIIKQLMFSVNAVMKGYLFIALIQGTLMGIGLWIFNVPNPALWGVVAAVMSLIPTVGTAIVSAPAVIYLFATGETTSAFGLLVWAALVVGMIDNFLSPVIVGKKINISPLLILFSVLGGISFLGPVGVIVGPLTVSFLYTLIAIYKNDFRADTAS